MHEARSIACFAWRGRCIAPVMRRNKNKLGKNHRTEEIVAASGTVAGAVFGTVAGPVGTVAGAILRGVVRRRAALAPAERRAHPRRRRVTPMFARPFLDREHAGRELAKHLRKY